MAIDNFRGSQEVTRAAHTPHVRDIGRLMCLGRHGGWVHGSWISGECPTSIIVMPWDTGNNFWEYLIFWHLLTILKYPKSDVKTCWLNMTLRSAGFLKIQHPRTKVPKSLSVGFSSLQAVGLVGNFCAWKIPEVPKSLNSMKVFMGKSMENHINSWYYNNISVALFCLWS